ncbi:transglycosylase domain-containing protein [Granulicella sibirica]|uniref:Multimodular transpeptidase-transglycosylase n=1 Tax=Granulicella sibirica TaxID=2479048 RepID=A0A4Q0T081_9BACT|nr:transglycosylase domain-containing protein [Granulicella sibirica]RXH55338.1 Multimodular transpeptidase-transglycosylase [Granulicella sibirica]
MAVKLKYGPTARANRRGFFRGLGRGVLLIILACLLICVGLFAFYYSKYQKVVDDRFASGPIFASVAQIYAAPREIRIGQKLTVDYIARSLRTAGYNSNAQLGSFEVNGDNILIKPGPESFHSTDGATINTSGDTVQTITAENGVALRSYELEPLLITALSEDKGRGKRRLVTYKEIPPHLVQAVTSIEDRRFFEHSGINFVRIAKCGFEDLVQHHMTCGGSTLTQQLAKNFFLSRDKVFTRKIKELFITLQLEAHFTKQQIFEMYANEINIGQRGSFAINGFGEASQAFFGKPIGQLDLAQCATLAGLIQNPNRRNPYRHPDRALERRNVVLDSMVETGSITADEASRAKAEPLRLAPPNVDASEAPYFVDLVHDQLVQRIGDQDLSHQSLRIYTSLDPELQRVASEAVEIGMRHVDDLVRAEAKRHSGPVNYPQVSLIALNPHTGQILALIGGRNYGVSQLNHGNAMRPTGSIFKPFVYATAFNTSLNGTSLDESGVFTAVTKINDDSQDFVYDGKSYTPDNFKHGEFPGMVTAADALAHSLNIATIALAQKVGYGNVAALARTAGITDAKGTPSVAIGTYSASPIDMAGAYTVFANNGVHLKPWALASVRNNNGDIVADFAPEAKQVLDPRVSFLTQSLLEGVINRGTASAVRAQGFNVPAAGKTGTSHDAWFAGYTSSLLCIIWVGNDDYTNVNLEGAKAAAPLWAEFMTRAIKLPQYSDTKPFTPPTGVTNYRLDRETNLLADSSCPKDYTVAFLDGTAPQSTCSRMTQSPQSLIQDLFNTTTPPPPPVPR